MCVTEFDSLTPGFASTPATTRLRPGFHSLIPGPSQNQIPTWALGTRTGWNKSLRNEAGTPTLKRKYGSWLIAPA